MMAKRAKGWMRVFASALIVTGVAACASQPPLPQDNFYRLEVTPPARAMASPRLDGVAEVQRFSAEGLIAARPIAYTEEGTAHQLHAYHYHFWIEPPISMLQDRLVSYLRDAGAARTVVTPAMRVEPDYVVQGRIVRFERVLGATPKVRVELELGVVARADGRVLFVKTYREDRDQGGDDGVTAAAAAFSTAVSEIYARFLADLTSH
ncbi:MAG: PqiC family protein [Rhodospirillales bacterium]|nr:PqiC family protein [Rhodospirillales bacterium]